MKKIASVTVALVLGTLLTSCIEYKPAQSSGQSTNNAFQVEFLFEYEGVRVYRFTDAERSMYYTNAAGVTQWQQQEGKAFVRQSVATQR